MTGIEYDSVHQRLTDADAEVITLAHPERRRYRMVTACCALLVGLGAIYVFFTPLIVGMFTYHVENGDLMASIVGLWDPRVQRTHERCRAYYEEQRPHFERAAKSFVLHPYFDWTAKHFNRADISYYDLVEKRLHMMAELLRTQGRDDFAIEKSKCVMNRFHENANIRIPKLVGNWSDVNTFLAGMRSGAALSHVKWPVFIKFCHLTQGSADSVRRIKSQKWLEENWETFAQWTEAKWSFVGDDWTRPWRAESNALTTGLAKGIYAQAAAALTLHAGEWRVLEVKIEVLWGVPYLGILFPQLAGARGGDSHLILRRSDGTFEEVIYSGYFGLYAHAGEPAPTTDRWYQWAFDEGGLECAFRLASKTARIIGVDQMRFDIFIARGHPDSCEVNENSLSSGHPYGGHGNFLAKLWLEPHLMRSFKVATERASKPIYEATGEPPAGTAVRAAGKPAAQGKHAAGHHMRRALSSDELHASRK